MMNSCESPEGMKKAKLNELLFHAKCLCKNDRIYERHFLFSCFQNSTCKRFMCHGHAL